MLVPIFLLTAAALAPQTTDPTLPPSGVTPAITVEGHGVQIYICAPQNGTFAWVFQSPEATLFDLSTRQQVGTHTAGPTWTWNDGSSIQGKVLRTQPASDPKSNIPSLLLETHPVGAATGALSGIVYVRRSNTQAGSAPPAGCDAQHQGVTLRVPYAATYTFYKKTP